MDEEQPPFLRCTVDPIGALWREEYVLFLSFKVEKSFYMKQAKSQEKVTIGATDGNGYTGIIRNWRMNWDKIQNIFIEYIELYVEGPWIKKMKELTEKYPHKCFNPKCANTHLSFEEMIDANTLKDIDIEQLEALWKNKRIKLYCCACYRKHMNPPLHFSGQSNHGPFWEEIVRQRAAMNNVAVRQETSFGVADENGNITIPHPGDIYYAIAEGANLRPGDIVRATGNSFDVRRVEPDEIPLGVVRNIPGHDENEPYNDNEHIPIMIMGPNENPPETRRSMTDHIHEFNDTGRCGICNHTAVEIDEEISRNMLSQGWHFEQEYNQNPIAPPRPGELDQLIRQEEERLCHQLGIPRQYLFGGSLTANRIRRNTIRTRVNRSLEVQRARQVEPPIGLDSEFPETPAGPDYSDTVEPMLSALRGPGWGNLPTIPLTARFNLFPSDQIFGSPSDMILSSKVSFIDKIRLWVDKHIRYRYLHKYTKRGVKKE